MCWQLQFVHKWTKCFNLHLFEENTKWVDALFLLRCMRSVRTVTQTIHFFFLVAINLISNLSTTAFSIRLQNYSYATNKHECISTIQFIESDSIKIRSEKVAFLCQYYKLHNFKMSTKMWIIWSSFFFWRKKKQNSSGNWLWNFIFLFCCCHEIINRRRCHNNQQSWFRSTAFNLCTDFPS